jgi:hypothetical protein
MIGQTRYSLVIATAFPIYYAVTSNNKGIVHFLGT